MLMRSRKLSKIPPRASTYFGLEKAIEVDKTRAERFGQWTRVHSDRSILNSAIFEFTNYFSLPLLPAPRHFIAFCCAIIVFYRDPGTHYGSTCYAGQVQMCLQTTGLKPSTMSLQNVRPSQSQYNLTLNLPPNLGLHSAASNTPDPTGSLLTLSCMEYHFSMLLRRGERILLLSF
jgi:hypothetical protein